MRTGANPRKYRTARQYFYHCARRDVRLFGLSIESLLQETPYGYTRWMFDSTLGMYMQAQEVLRVVHLVHNIKPYLYNRSFYRIRPQDLDLPPTKFFMLDNWED